ncbi:CAP domain-containing protein [Paenibacillus sp. 481]|uniref:CAP domain-containing protein n=1 Tax=Paenibacillus sp. 481 TaxID=2835869 RepID=UPI001E48998A|nr:CAP domain-containing protein [Paenibacillus sp. 481]UHA72700.1 serine protease [Paenibacillus sp. 481]
MKKHMTKVVVAGALALTPVISAGAVSAAPAKEPVQVQNPNCFVNFQGFQGNKGNMDKALADLMEKYFPGMNKPGTEKPSKPSKPEVQKPEVTKPEQPSKPTNPSNNGNNENQDKNNFAQQVINLVNQERSKAGLQPLKADSQLNDVAMVKAKDMHSKNYFSHTSPTYGSPFDMMKQFGVKYNTAGENIAKGQQSPAQVMKDWMNSPGHRENIMKGQYSSIGVAYYNGVWVQLFKG